MSANKLKIDSGKTVIILFGIKQKLKAVGIPSRSFTGTKFFVTDSPTMNFSTMFDYLFSMTTALVNNVVRTANYHLRNIGSV